MLMRHYLTFLASWTCFCHWHLLTLSWYLFNCPSKYCIAVWYTSTRLDGTMHNLNGWQDIAVNIQIARITVTLTNTHIHILTNVHIDAQMHTHTYTTAKCTCTFFFYHNKDKAMEILSLFTYPPCKNVFNWQHLSGTKIFKLQTALFKRNELLCIFYFR